MDLPEDVAAKVDAVGPLAVDKTRSKTALKQLEDAKVKHEAQIEEVNNLLRILYSLNCNIPNQLGETQTFGEKLASFKDDDQFLTSSSVYNPQGQLGLQIIEMVKNKSLTFSGFYKNIHLWDTVLKYPPLNTKGPLVGACSFLPLDELPEGSEELIAETKLSPDVAIDLSLSKQVCLYEIS